ncbi:hypothetical protein ABZ917_17630 [Nonomuraea wenchangensis]
MPEIPTEAVQAAAEALADYETAPHGDVRLNSQRAAAKAVAAAAPILAEQERADERRKYEDLLGAIWLYIGWRYVTRQLTTEQKNLFADAVAAELARGDGFDAVEAEAAVDRWWLNAHQAGDARDSR